MSLLDQRQVSTDDDLEGRKAPWNETHQGIQPILQPKRVIKL